MSNEMMDLEQLAVYLHRDARELSKMASRGHLPGHKVSGQWRFARAEINHWLETQMPGLNDQQLTAMESRHSPGSHEELVVTPLLSQACMAVPMGAATKASALRELVRLAEQSWQVYDPTGLHDALKLREESATTALDCGVAIPHPRRPMPTILGESIIAYGRTGTGIPFGGPRGMLTDIFFLVCCRDEKTHLAVLARLARLLLRPNFVDQLRAAETVADTWQLIAKTEQELTA